MTYWAYEAVSQCRAAQSASFTMETRQLFWMVNYSNFFWRDISIYARRLQSRFLSTSDSKFSSQLLLKISKDSTFAFSDFSSPGDIYIICVSALTILIIICCTCESKSKDKWRRINRNGSHNQQLAVLANVCAFFLNCPAFITRHVCQHPLLWISDVLDSHTSWGLGGGACLPKLINNGR